MPRDLDITSRYECLHIHAQTSLTHRSIFLAPKNASILVKDAPQCGTDKSDPFYTVICECLTGIGLVEYLLTPPTVEWRFLRVWGLEKI